MMLCSFMLIAERFSIRSLSLGIWLILVFAVVIGWLYQWIMDDSR